MPLHREAARGRSKEHRQRQGKNTRATRARQKVENPSWVVDDGYENEWYEDKEVEATIACYDYFHLAMGKLATIWKKQEDRYKRWRRVQKQYYGIWRF